MLQNCLIRSQACSVGELSAKTCLSIYTLISWSQSILGLYMSGCGERGVYQSCRACAVIILSQTYTCLFLF